VNANAGYRPRINGASSAFIVGRTFIGAGAAGCSGNIPYHQKNK